MVKKGMLILGPNDPPPRPDRLDDYLYYRGVAQEKECKKLFHGLVSLGCYLEPYNRHGRELFLNHELLTRHCAVIGRTGVGKTAGIVIPWITSLLKNGYSVVTVDVVGNLLDPLSEQAQKLGCRFWYWDSGNPTISNSWNWLNEIDISDDNDLEAAIFSILGKANPQDPNRFFWERDVRWLRALIPIVKTVYGNKSNSHELYRLVADKDSLRYLFTNFPQVRKHEFVLRDLLCFSLEEHSKAVSGLLNALDIFIQSSVEKITEKNDFFLSNIDTEPTLLVIGDRQGNHRSAQLTSLIISQLFNHVHRRARGLVTNRIPLYFMLDEAPRLKDKVDYEAVLAIARNANTGICIAAQDVSQFGDERKTSEILNNCNTIITTKGVPPETATYLSRQLGKRRERKVNVPRQQKLTDSFQAIDEGKSLLGVILDTLFTTPNSSIDTIELPVLGEREIMHPPIGAYPAVVLVSPVVSKPFLIDLDLVRRTF